MDDPAAILSELTPENSRDWQHVGGVLRRLNRISEVSKDGRPWHDVVLEAVAANGHPMSSGHLHRIRRACHLLKVGMSERKIPEERAALAKISSIDQAERLFQLDHEAGLDALEACLDIKKPATKADIQKRYEDYLEAHPEKKTPMQAAWDRRRAKQDRWSSAAPQKILAESMSISDMLGHIAKYINDLEISAKKDAATIEELEQEISDINIELTEAKQILQIVSEEYNELKQKYDARWQ